MVDQMVGVATTAANAAVAIISASAVFTFRKRLQEANEREYKLLETIKEQVLKYTRLLLLYTTVHIGTTNRITRIDK